MGPVSLSPLRRHFEASGGAAPGGRQAPPDDDGRAPGRPRVSVTVTPFVEASLAALRAGELDLALAASGKISGFESQALSREPFTCLVRRGHPLLSGRVTPRRFAAADHVLISPRGRVVGAVDHALRRRGLRRSVALVVPTFLAAAQAPAESDLVLTCALRSAERATSWLPLQVLEPPVAIAPFTLSAFWHARQSGDPFLEHVRRVVAARPDQRGTAGALVA